jgi:diaminohydroxyphosphoribosylaminopyrimidine deaminase/5-amino-6-(5-phosphoribosylamino)uracil reductase
MPHDHKSYLQKCIVLALEQLGDTAPNPSVAAIIVKDGEIIGSGVHQGSGMLHAEPLAIAAAGAAAQDSTIYVSLEPCAHYGKTPPCTQAILQAGIKQVYYAHHDVDVRVCGAGRRFLLAHGIGCELIALSEAKILYRYYDFWQQHNRPWVTAKLALSADYKVATANKEPIAISGEVAKHYSHQMRKQHDAILSTAITVNNDDPSFNVRLDGVTEQKPLFIIDSKLQINIAAKIWHTAKNITLFYTADAPKENISKLNARGATCVAVATSADGKINLAAVLDYIGTRGVHALWVEVGPACLHGFYQQQLLQRLILFVSSKELGAECYGAEWLADAMTKHDSLQSELGLDVMYDFCFIH